MAALARCFIRCFDAFLRRVLGIWEFTQDPRCIFRLGRGRCRGTVRLSDGTTLHPGTPVLELHLWNERLPSMPPQGPDLAWGVRFIRRWNDSLHLLAQYLRANPAFRGTRALRAVFAIPDGTQLHLWRRTLSRLGFDTVQSERRAGQAFTDFWENLYNWAILWTYNPASLRSRRFWRLKRCTLWMSLEWLLSERPAPHEAQE